MRFKAVGLCFLLLVTMYATPHSQGNSGGKFNSSSGCSCHNTASTLTPTLSGYPDEYEPDTTYTITISSVNPVFSTGGFSLESSQGFFSNPGTSVKLSSNSNPKSATHTNDGQNSWQVDWTSPPEGSGTVSLSVAVVNANNANGNNGDIKGTLSVQIPELVSSNIPPTITNLTILPDQPNSSSTLVASYEYADYDGNEEAGTSFEWFVNGSLVASLTNSTVPPSELSRGQEWHVVVTPSDGTSIGTAVTSTAVTVENTPPVVFNIVISPENPDTFTHLSMSFETSDADGDSVITSLYWEVNGEYNPFIAENSLDVPKSQTRNGDLWQAVINASDGMTTSVYRSPLVLIGAENSPPILSNLTLSSTTPTSSESVELSWIMEDDDGDSEQTFETIWQKNGEVVEFLRNQKTLDFSHTSKGDQWGVMVRVSDGINWSGWNTSEQILIQNAHPVIQSIDVTSTSFTSSDNLSIVYTSFDEDGDTISIERVVWRSSDGQEVTTTVPHISHEMLKKDILWNATLTVTDGEDESIALTSAQFEIKNSPPSAEIHFSQTPISKQVLSPIIEFNDADEDEIFSSITWYRNGFRDGTLDQLTSVPAEKIGPGQEWRIVIELSDGEATGIIVEHVIVIENAPPSAIFQQESEQLWIGEVGVFNASSSDDSDGEITSYRWVVRTDEDSRQYITTEPRLEFLLDPTFTISLYVTDSSGAQTMVEQSFIATQGPKISSLIADQQGAKYTLSWQWDGPDATFRIYEQGRLVGQTTATSFTSTSSLATAQTFDVIPVIDGVELQAGQAMSEPVDFTQAQLDDEPSSISSMVLAVVLMLLGAGVIIAQTRKEGDR